jgi:Protein of unknown function (DUF3761)
MRRFQIGIVAACAFAWAATGGVAGAQAAAATTTVTCKDGTSGTAGRGACSHHGGVATGAATTPAATAPAAAAPAAPAATASGASVTCKDGTTGTAGRGACSHHGGVGTATTSSTGAVAAAPAAKTPATTPAPAPAPKPAATTPAATAPAATTPAATTKAAGTTTGSTTGKSETTDPTGAIAQCKDGLYSHSKTHTGTCSRHGGVAKWLDGTSG